MSTTTTPRPRLWQSNDENRWRLFHRPGTGWYAYQPVSIHEPMFPAQSRIAQAMLGGQYAVMKESGAEALTLLQLAMAKAAAADGMRSALEKAAA